MTEEINESVRAMQRQTLGENIRLMYVSNRDYYNEPNEPSHVYTRGFHADQVLQYIPLVLAPEEGSRFFQVDVITKLAFFQIEEDAIDFIRQRAEKSGRVFSDNGKRFFIKHATTKQQETENE